MLSAMILINENYDTVLKNFVSFTAIQLSEF